MFVPGSSAGKESACNAGVPSLIPGLGRSAGEGIGYPLQYSWASLVAQLIKNLPAMRETWVQSQVGLIPWRRERLPTPVFWPGEFHGLYNSGLGRFPGEGKGYPLQYSGLENSTDCIIHGVAKSWTQLSNLQFHFFQKFIVAVFTKQS